MIKKKAPSKKQIDSKENDINRQNKNLNLPQESRKESPTSKNLKRSVPASVKSDPDQYHKSLSKKSVKASDKQFQEMQRKIDELTY